MNVEWSQDALADLDRFARLSPRQVSLRSHRAWRRRSRTRRKFSSEFPQSGRPLAGREEYRQIVLAILNARYVFQYRYDGERLVILRVFHGREARE